MLCPICRCCAVKPNPKIDRSTGHKHQTGRAFLPSRRYLKTRLGGCHLQPPFSPGSSRQPRSGHAPQPTTPSGVPTHPGKQLSAVFAGRPRGRLNTDHNSDADRVGPNSGQPGNTTPRGPSPPRSIVRRALQLASPFAQHPLRQSHFCALCHSARLGTTFGHSVPAPPCNIHPRLIHTTCPITHLHYHTNRPRSTPVRQGPTHNSAPTTHNTRVVYTDPQLTVPYDYYTRCRGGWVVFRDFPRELHPGRCCSFPLAWGLA